MLKFSKIAMKTKTLQFNWSICGHEKIVHFLQSSIDSDNVSQAYLFAGPSHLGKEKVARKFIASLLCTDQEKHLPCGECLNCRQLKNGLHPDFYVVEQEINAKTEKFRREIVIDQIRNLKYKLSQATLFNGYKAALITKAQLMNLNTANALLKVLEEPTPKTVIIILADDLTNLPLTILSRCQVLRFLPVANNEIKSYLEKNTTQDADLIARQSHGRPGLALTLIGDQEFERASKNNIDNFFKVSQTDLNSRLSLVDKLVDWDKDEALNISRLNTLLAAWQTVIRDIILIKSANEPLVANIKHLEQLKELSASWDFLKIKFILRKINQCSDYLFNNINSKSVLENLIINL